MGETKKKQNTKKIYVVFGRYGTELFTPTVFNSKKEAEKFAKSEVMDYAMDAYFDDTGKSTKPRFSTLEKWAEERGYEFSDSYFWDGGSDAIEMQVTEHLI